MTPFIQVPHRLLLTLVTITVRWSSIAIIAGPVVYFSDGSVFGTEPGQQQTTKEDNSIKADYNRLMQSIRAHDWWEAERRSSDLRERLKRYEADNSAEMCRQRVTLAMIYKGQGRLTEARNLLRNEVKLLRNFDSLSKRVSPSDYPQALNILAEIERDLQDSDSAIRHVEEVLELARNRDLKAYDTPAVAFKIRGLIRAGQGDYRLARDDFNAALEIALSWKMQQPLFVATLHSSIAATWVSEAEELRAEHQENDSKQRLKEADSFLRKAEEFCDSINQIDNNAAYFIENVRNTRAILESAVALADRRTEANLPYRTWIATSGDLFPTSSNRLDDVKALRLNNSAIKLIDARRFVEADTELTRCIDLLKGSPSSNSRLLIRCVLNQAILLGAFMQRADEGARLSEVALDLLYEVILKEVSFQSRRQQLLILAPCEKALEHYLSFAMKAGKPAQELYLQVFRWKGILLDLYSKQTLKLEVHERYNELYTAASEARVYYERCNASPSASKEDRVRARESMEMKERMLSNFVMQFGSTQIQGANSLEKLSSQLSPGTVLLDYVVYNDLAPGGHPTQGNSSGNRFLVFVVRAGSPEVFNVTLGSVEDLGREISLWRRLITDFGQADRKSDLRSLSKHIADGIWKPVEAFCQDARLLLVCPIGLLWTFPFAALPDTDGNYLIQRIPIAYTFAARLVSQSSRPSVERSKKTLLVNMIKYASDPDPIQEGPMVTQSLKRWISEPDLVPLEGEKATKKAFLEALRKSGTNVCFVGHGIASADAKLVPKAIKVTDMSSDPFRFRLPLAGASLSPLPKPKDQEWVDSWLSQDEMVAEIPEIANRFEFWSCGLFVGTLHPTEGMMNYPRTLLLGGYRTVISPQWPSVHTRSALVTIATRFHDGIFNNGLGEALALQKAMCAAIELGGVNADPYHWAAWVAIGDPGPIASDAPQPPPPPTYDEKSHLDWHVVLTLTLASLLISALVGWSLKRMTRKSIPAGTAHPDGEATRETR